MSWSIDITQIAKEMKLTLDEAARGITISLFNGVIRDTRVDTGRLRGNWQTSVGQPERGTITRKDQIAQGGDGGQSQDEVVNTVQAAEVNYLTNNLPYAEIWEQRDGMIARNIARIDRTVSEVVRDVRS